MERVTGLASTGVTGTARSFLDPLASARAGDVNSEDRSGLAPDMLAALLGAWLGGRVGGRVGGALHGLLSDGEGELVGDGVEDVVVEREASTWMDGGETNRGCKSRWLLPGPRKWESRSGLDDLCCVALAWPLVSGRGCDVTGVSTPLRCDSGGL